MTEGNAFQSRWALFAILTALIVFAILSRLGRLPVSDTPRTYDDEPAQLPEHSEDSATSDNPFKGGRKSIVEEDRAGQSETHEASEISCEFRLMSECRSWGPFLVLGTYPQGDRGLGFAEIGITRFEGVAAGLTELSVQRQGWLTQRLPVREGPGNQVYEVPVEPLGSIGGVVLTMGERKPVANFDLKLETKVGHGSGFNTIVKTFSDYEDSSGIFCVAQEEDDASQIRVTIKADGFLPSASNWELIMGSHATLPDFELQQSQDCSVYGRLVGPDGAAPEGALAYFVPGVGEPEIVLGQSGEIGVRATIVEGPLARAMVGDDDVPHVVVDVGPGGTFSLGLPCGAEGRIVVVAKDLMPYVSEAFSVREASVTPLVIHLKGLSSIRLYVAQSAHSLRTVELDGAFIRQGAVLTQAAVVEQYTGEVSVTIYSANYSIERSGHIEVRGHRRSPKDQHFATVALARLAFPVGASSEQHVFLGVGQGGGELVGALVLPDEVEQDLALAVLYAEGNSEPIMRSFVDSRGRFEFAGLSPGQCHLRVYASGPEFLGCLLVWDTTVNVEDGLNDMGKVDLSSLRSVNISGMSGGLWKLVPQFDYGFPGASGLVLRSSDSGELKFIGVEAGFYKLVLYHGDESWDIEVSSEMVQTIPIR